MIDHMGDTDRCPQISVTFHINGDSSRMMSRKKVSKCKFAHKTGPRILKKTGFPGLSTER